MMGNHWWSRSAEGLLRRIGISYELRIRLTLAFMFPLIVVATVNSVRYFRIVESTQQEKFRQETVRRLELVAADLRVNPPGAHPIATDRTADASQRYAATAAC